MKRNIIFLGLLCLFVLLNGCQNGATDIIENQDWDHYLGDASTNQYSPLNQINVDNVDQLQVAWTYNSNDADEKNRSQIQCNPLVIDGVLYGTSPQLKLFALDAKMGLEKWVFDPFDGSYKLFGMGVNRGLTSWMSNDDHRILYSAGSRLYAVDAKTGKLVADFGTDGSIDLKAGLGDLTEKAFVVSNTPGIIFENLIIVGSRVNESTHAAPGHIRAFDVITGELEWVFHTIPKPGEDGYDTWPTDAYKRIGGANAWSGMSIDRDRGVVYIPTGSASFDFYGGDREGENLFANCILALDARTGERKWHYQTVHHDLWDRDLPAPPNLVTVNVDGKEVDALAQITKSSHIFLLNRDTGEPIHEVNEVPVPPSTLDGESAWPTQPIPVKPPPFARERITEADLTDRTAEANEYAKAILSSSKEGAPFIPPSLEGTLLFPGFDGGGEWGGAAVDKENVLYVNASEMPWILQMIPYNQEPAILLAEYGRNLYNTSCMLCHGKDLEGGAYQDAPALTELGSKMSRAQVEEIIIKGKGQMPAFGYLKENEVAAISAFLLDLKDPMPKDQIKKGSDNDWPYPYVMAGYKKFVDEDGFPAIKPPWGTLNAIDLEKGEILWKSTLGHHPKLPPASAENQSGVESYGGPVVTAGDIIFMAGTMDAKFRAFNKRNGDLLHETDLPAAGYATPSVYAIDGQQYVVIACGGGKLGTDSGDSYVAFALPD